MSNNKQIVVSSFLPYTPYPDEVVYVEGGHTIKVERWRIEYYHDIISNMLNTPEGYAESYAELIIQMMNTPVFWEYFSDEERHDIESEIIDKFNFLDFVEEPDSETINPSIFVYEKSFAEANDILGFDEKHVFRQFEVGEGGLLLALKHAFDFMDHADEEAGKEYEASQNDILQRDNVIADLKDQVSKLNALLELYKSKLKEFGLTSMDVEDIMTGHQRPKKLYITKKHKFYISNRPLFSDKCPDDMPRTEIRLSPLDKAIYLLFLNHPEGINFSYLPDYREELLVIYRSLMNYRTSAEMVRSVEDVTDPTKNSINEKCARIRRAFVSHLGAYKAEPYIISGPRGEKKKISLDRDYVQFEQS